MTVEPRLPLAHLADELAAGPVSLVELPLRAQFEVRGGEAPPGSLWLGPGWYLALGAEPPAADGRTVVDVSGARTILELSGPHARDVLEHGCAIDLHPRAFPVGASAQTNLAKAPAILHRTGDERYEIYVRASFADYLARWLLDAMVEYS